MDQSTLKNRTFDEIEDDLRRDYEATRGEGSRREDATAAQLEWEDARHATMIIAALRANPYVDTVDRARG